MAGSLGASSRMAFGAIGGQGHILTSKGHGSVLTFFKMTKQRLVFDVFLCVLFFFKVPI